VTLVDVDLFLHMLLRLGPVRIQQHFLQIIDMSRKLQQQAAEALCCPVVRPSVVRPLTPTSRDAISLCVGRISMKLATYMKVDIGEDVLKVRGQWL